LTTAWLNETVGASRGWPEICDLKRQGGDSGTTDRSRVVLEAAAPAGFSGNPATTPPQTLFVKTRSRKFSTALFTNLMDLGRNEVGFYRQIRAAAHVRTPEPYFADYDPASGRFLLLLEDLAGDGVQFMDVSTRCTRVQAEQVVCTLARLHASYWESPRFQTDLAWVTTFENDSKRGLLRILRRAAIRSVLRNHADLIPESVASRVDELDAAHDLLELHWSASPRTLLHGDAHIGNMFFTGEEVGFLDWQVIRRGRGLRDLAYFIINSVPTELRCTYQEQWIQRYLDTLVQEGVREPPTFEAAWEQYRLYAFFAWIAAVVTAAAGSFQSAKIARAGLSRASQVLCELKSFDALRVLR